MRSVSLIGLESERSFGGISGKYSQQLLASW